MNAKSSGGSVDGASGATVDCIVGGVVSAPVTLANANVMAAAGEHCILSSPEVRVQLDMRNVGATSAGVAVALAWLAVAAREGKELRLENLSPEFNDVVEFSDVGSMFEDHISETH